MSQDNRNLGKNKTGTDVPRLAAIRALNDDFRGSFAGGRVMLTTGVMALDANIVGSIIASVQGFSEFTYENDPYGEHDFGALTKSNQRVLWKIDYYDRRLEYESPDPADPNVTTRVLTIMLASEY